MVKLQLLSKKIHRLLALIVTGLAVLMMITGINMKYGWFETIIAYDYSRVLHNLLSTYFAIALSLMAITGLFMFFFPYWQRYENKKKQQSRN